MAQPDTSPQDSSAGRLPDPRGPDPQGPSTVAIHAGEDRQKLANSITDPIICAATYTFAKTQDLIDFVEHDVPRHEYGRYGNPGERTLERKLAALDQGEDSVLFATGMAAIVGLLMAKLNAGDEVVFFDECYHRSREFCMEHLSRFGVVSREIRTGDYDAMEAAVTPRTRLLISESPTNPHLSVIDLHRFARIGRQHHVETLIDATLATPYNVQPLTYGIDYVLHSGTKYLAGHNDLLAGVIVGSREKLDSIRTLRGITGSINSPHNIYLMQRGVKTFALRMQRHNANGMAVSEFLAGHPRVSSVLYPGLESHPCHEIARRTMRGFGGLITFYVKDADWQETARVIDRVKLPRIGPSLGGVESLIEQPMVMSYHGCTPEHRERFGIADNMIRLACGIEDAKDLISDLEQALDA